MPRPILRSLPVSLSSLILLISASVSPSLAGPSTVDDSKCDCYISNGSDVAYYSYHEFFDFRSLSQYQGTPALLQDAAATTDALATSDYFNNGSWTSFWEIQNWNNSDSLGGASNSTVLRINTRNNVYIEQNTDPGATSATWLTLRTARQTMFQSAAEIVTANDSYQYLSMRMLARTTGAPGGCTAMFTYRSADSNGGGDVQEADLEVLTKYPTDQVQCTNQPSVNATTGDLIAAATENVTLPNNLTWDGWAVYRLDWTPRQSTWYVDGEQIANISFQTPRDASRIHLNAWSDGSNWTGTMPFRSEAHLQVQWWELLYNSTARAPQADAVCHAVCSVDAVNASAGLPVMVSDSLAPGRLLNRRGEGLAALAAWIPSAVMLAMLLGSLSVLQ